VIGGSVTQVYLHKIVEHSYVDGPGDRVVVFFQGCPIHCAGCQNIAIWERKDGKPVGATELAREVARIANGRGVTISGGEPMAQPAALAELVLQLRRFGVGEIIVYTGYRLEELLDFRHPAYIWTFSLFSAIDILVDGPFVKALDNPFISYRGSTNQRPIDIRATIAAKEVVVLDWSSPEIVLTADGSALMPVGLAPEFAEIGEVDKAARCGQLERKE
jgi:anaerobic ribonucleoside-triphosphate reductase activating protein